MAPVNFLHHTADIRMHVVADTPAELFREALRGMNSILFTSPPEDKPVQSLTYTLHLSSPDITALLIDTLSDILSESFMRKAVFDTMTIKALSESAIDAVLTGRPVTHFDEDIKAVTYHEADITQDAEGHWQTVIIFDI